MIDLPHFIIPVFGENSIFVSEAYLRKEIHFKTKPSGI